MIRVAALIAIAFAGRCLAAPVPGLLPDPVAPAKSLAALVRVNAPTIVLDHARIIDGLLHAPQDNQTIVIDHGRIAAIGPDGVPTPPQAQHVDLTGETVLPGFVGMHNHLFYIARPNLRPGDYDDPLLLPEMAFSAPRLYLAGGVTTMRTTGSIEPYTDLNLKRAIDAGKLAGPHIDVTGPYMEGVGAGHFIQMYQLKDAEDARRTVDYWADRGVTSFKAYTDITRAELGAVIDEAHRRGLKVTGHLCSVTYPEAAALGIDDLEHGFFVNTQLDPGKVPDQCPRSSGQAGLMKMEPGGADAVALIQTLVANHVAVTSTLPIFEGVYRSDAMHLPQPMLDSMTEQSRASLRVFSEHKFPPPTPQVFARGMALEREFVAAGGLLLAGPDPTGFGSVLPGFGDQREVELLVEAGFSPLEAIHIATYNGAAYLGVADRIGSVESGKDADLVVVRGDPSHDISDIEKVDIVFKDGVGWDAAKLLASVKGDYGQY